MPDLKYIFIFFLLTNKCISVELTLLFLVALLGAMSELAMHSIIWRADARLNYSNCEGDAAAYPSPCLRRWKDEMRRSESARKTGYTGKSYIKPYPPCLSVIHLPQHPPTYGLPSLASTSPVRISTLLYLIQSRLYSAGWLRVEDDLARLSYAGLQKLRIATRNKRHLRETRWINLTGSLESDYFNPLRILLTLRKVYS